MRLLQVVWAELPFGMIFLGHTKDSFWSIDLFRCESIHLKSHWVLVVMDHFTRRITGFGVHAGGVDGVALCRMFNTAISTQGAPYFLSSDNDPLFRYHRWQANLRILEIQEIKTFPYVPLSHPFIEQVIGTIRHEFLDHVIYWNANDLERKLEGFRQYYNAHRVHTSLDGNTPSETIGETTSRRAGLNQFQMEWTRSLFEPRSPSDHDQRGDVLNNGEEDSSWRSRQSVLIWRKMCSRCTA